ncbi:MAG: proteasome-activating nucleotidase [Thermoplasmata archaeon]
MVKDESITDGELGFDEEKIELSRQLKITEDEKKFLEAELKRLQIELERTKRELNRMRAPPLLLGYVEDVLSDKKAVVKSTTGPSFVVGLSEFIAPTKVKAGARVALNKTTLAVIGVLPESYDPSVIAAEIITKPGVSYEDIGGLESQILEIKETVETPLLNPDIYKKVGIDPPKGVLLIGPPGTGKTLLAKAVANNTNATFIRTVGSELVRKYIGEGARLVREMFDLAKEKAPSILFIDEIDAIGARRQDASTSGDREVQRTLMQLLAEMDGFDPLGNVKIVAATNRPDILDEALIRPGRFDRIIDIPAPNEDARAQIFKIHTKKMNLQNIDFMVLSKKTNNMSGADIKAICTEAGMFAIREKRDYITMYDFEKAIKKVSTQEENNKNIVSGQMFA